MSIVDHLVDKLNNNPAFVFTSVILVIISTLFLYLWIKEPRRLITGNIFALVVLIWGFWLSILIFKLTPPVIRYLWSVAFVVGILLILLLSSFAWLFLLWNAYFIWKYESHTLPNMLTLLMGFALIGLWLYQKFTHWLHLPPYLAPILGLAPTIATYLIIVMLSFIINVFLYQFYPKKYCENYLIVLGAGLINGTKVSTLLANRINASINYAKKVKKKTGNWPKIIMSGGQGPDEELSEAAAMAEYAIKAGIPREIIILENQSTTTLENMTFSKKIIKKDTKTKPYTCKFFSNNYHIFRAAILAKKANLSANGVGAPTRLYYLPNALLREFAAIFVLNKKRHIIVISLLTLISVISLVIQLIFH